MGDVYRKVRICGVDADGRRAGRATVTALLDTGATASVIPRSLARRLRGVAFPKFDRIEGRRRDTMMAMLKLQAPDCRETGRLVVVDDRLAARAGPRARMILGSDYMQRTRIALLLSMDRHDEYVGCRRGPASRRGARPT